MLVRVYPEDEDSGTYWLFNASTLDTARLVSSARGFHDVDVEPMERGRVKVTAHGINGVKLTFNGITIHDACHKLIEALASEQPVTKRNT